MKVSELRPCDNCEGAVLPQFYVVRISLAIVSQPAMRQIGGMIEMMGGLDNPGALAVAETLAPHAEKAIVIAMDEKPELKIEIFICQKCYLGKKFNLAELGEKARANQKKIREIIAADQAPDPPQSPEPENFIKP